MTYFDPEVYDWRELKGDDAEFMAGYNYATEELESAFANIRPPTTKKRPR